MWHPVYKTAEEHKQDLIALHNSIKNHIFRRVFIDDSLKGTHRALCKDYMNLIYESTEKLSNLAYYTTDRCIVDKKDLFWIHDFRSLIFTIEYIHSEDRDLLKPLNPNTTTTRQDIYQMTGLTDISTVMLYLEKYLQFLHRFIETGELNDICSVRMKEFIPGWYLREMVILHRDSKDQPWIEII